MEAMVKALLMERCRRGAAHHIHKREAAQRETVEGGGAEAALRDVALGFDLTEGR